MSKQKKRKKSAFEMSHWDVCSRYPPEDWRHEVADDNTRLGYREWVEHQIEMEKEDDNPLSATLEWPSAVDIRFADQLATDCISELHTRYKALNKSRSDTSVKPNQTLEEVETEMVAIALLNNFILESVDSDANYLEEDRTKFEPIEELK